MFVIACNLTAVAGQTEKFEKIIGDLAKGSVTEAGCRRFEVYKSIEDPNEYIMYEEWTDMGEEAGKIHTSADYYKLYKAESSNIIAKQSSVKYEVAD